MKKLFAATVFSASLSLTGCADKKMEETQIPEEVFVKIEEMKKQVNEIVLEEQNETNQKLSDYGAIMEQELEKLKKNNADLLPSKEDEEDEDKDNKDETETKNEITSGADIIYINEAK